METIQKGKESSANLLAREVSQQKQEEFWGTPVSFSFDFFQDGERVSHLTSNFYRAKGDLKLLLPLLHLFSAGTAGP